MIIIVAMKKVPNGIYIPDDLQKLFTVDEWMQRAHPETARTVVLGCFLMLLLNTHVFVGSYALGF